MAADYLLAGGYTVRERNWCHITASHRLEIDIIAQKGDEIIFVEVKSRDKSGQHPVDAVVEGKKRKMAWGADIYMRGLDRKFYYRFDIIAFIGTETDHVMHHIPNAFIAPYGLPAPRRVPRQAGETE